MMLSEPHRGIRWEVPIRPAPVCLADAGAVHRAVEKMSMDERWVDRSSQTMLETFHWFRGEGFDLIIEDL